MAPENKAEKRKRTVLSKDILFEKEFGHRGLSIFAVITDAPSCFKSGQTHRNHRPSQLLRE
jgi:hypothetical protein